MAAKMGVVISAEDKASGPIDGVQKKISEFGTGGGNVFSSLSGKITGLAASFAPVGIAAYAAFESIKGAVMPFVNAASEGEQAMVRLSSALKAMGQYSQATVDDVSEFSDALLKSKGVSDELTMSIIGQGATMGLTIAQSKRFVSAAADMESITGSVAAGFDALARAATGDERAIQTLGKQFGIAKTEGLSFEQLLAKIEERTDGAAAAKVKTFAGAWKLFSDEVGNFMEKAGTPLMNWLAQQPDQIRKAGDSWSTFFKSFGGDKAWDFLVKWQEAASRIGKDRAIMPPEPPAFTSLGGGAEKGRGIFYEFTNIEDGLKRAAELRAKSASARVALEKQTQADLAAIRKEWEEQEKVAHFETERLLQENTEKRIATELEMRRREFADEAAIRALKQQWAQEDLSWMSGKMQKQISVYEKLSSAHEQAMRKIERTEEEHQKRMTAIQVAQESVQAALVRVQSRGASESEQKVLARMEVQALLDKAKASEDLAEKLRLLAAAGNKAAEVDWSFSGFDRGLAGKSKIDGVAEFAGGIEKTSERNAAEAGQEVIRGIAAEVSKTLAEVSAADKMLLDSQQKTADAIATDMTAALESMVGLQSEAKALQDQINKDVSFNVNVDRSMLEVHRLGREIDLLIQKMIDTDTVLITATPMERKDVKMDENADAFPEVWGNLPSWWSHISTQSHLLPEGHGSTAVYDKRAGGGNVTFNITAKGVSAKELDAELADLWRRKGSKLRKAVAA